METDLKPVLAQSVYIPSFRTELQAFRARRSHRRIVLLSILYGALFAYLLVRIGIQAVKIFAFDMPHAVVSMAISGVLLLLFVFLFITVLTAPRRNAKRRMRQLLETHPAVPSVTTTFFEDEVVIRSDDERNGLYLQYPVLKRITETDDLFLLWTKEKQVFSIAKQNLTGVDLAGFRALLQEKCPKAKCRWRKEV